MDTAKYDIFLSHNSADKLAVEELAHRLRREGLEPWLDKWHLIPGEPWQSALERALDACATCLVCVGPNGVGPWQNEEMRAAIDRRVNERQFRVIPVLLPGAQRPSRSAVPTFLLATTWVEFRQSLEDTEALHYLVCGIRGIEPGPGEAIAKGICPYRGLKPFQPEHSRFFFGREALTEWLLAKMRPAASREAALRFLAIIGPSGSGKSSVARAGLVPALQHGKLESSAHWPMVICRPSYDPVESIAVALASDAVICTRLPAVGDLTARLRADQRTLHLATRLALHDAPEAHRVVLLVDQFEELFTLCRDEDLRRAAIDNLLYACSVMDGRASVILTMRADFYGKCAAYPALAAAISDHQELVGPMTEDELRRAIERPAQLVGCEFEAGLVEMLVRDVRGQVGALPLLQHALEELWERREGHHLTHAAYEATGGLAGALEKRADTLYTTFNETEQAICRRVLLRLTQPGEGTEDTKRRVVMAELWPVGGEVDRVETVVQRLADARLVTTEGTGQQPEGRVVEVAHEALIQGWPRLRGWLETDREALHIHRRLTEAAQAWEGLQRDAGVLYRGGLLAQAKAWYLEHADDVNPLERAFLEASIALQEEEEVAKERQRQRELEQAQALAETERQRAEEQARATTRLRRRAVALTVFFALAVLAAIGAWKQQQQATRFAKQATAAAEQATAAAEAEEIARLAAQDAQQQAVSGRNLAYARQLAAQATLALIDKPTNLVKAALLATESLKWAQTLEGYVVWEQVMKLLPRKVLRLVHEGNVDDFAFSPDGKQLVTIPRIGSTARPAGDAAVWEVATGAKLATTAHKGWVRAVAFSPDGQLLASASWDRSVAIMEVATGVERYRLTHDDPVWSLAFHPHGEILATGGGRGTIRIWDIATAQERYQLQHADGVVSLAFSPDGVYLATASHDQTARIWKGATGEELKRFSHPAKVKALALSPDGQLLATISYKEREARLWDVATGQERLRLVHDKDINDVSFSRDGSRVLTASQDGTMRLWDTLHGKEVVRFTHEMPQDEFARFLGYGAIVEAAISPDGTRIAAVVAGMGAAVMWDATTGAELFHVTHEDQVHAVAFSPDGQHLATGGKDSTIGLWDARTGEKIKGLKYDGTVDTVAFSPEGKHLATATRLSKYGYGWSEAILWDVETGKEQRRFGGHPGWMTDVIFSADGSLIATSSWNGAATLWDAGSGIARARLQHQGPVFSLALTPDMKYLVTGAGASAKADYLSAAHLWDLSSGQPITQLGDPGGVYSLQISQNRQRIATWGIDNTLRIWDTNTGTALSELQPAKPYSFSPDGQYLAMKEDDNNTIQVRDLENGHTIARLVHTGNIRNFVLGPKGKGLAAVVAAETELVWLWDVASKTVVAQVSHTDASPPGLIFSDGPVRKVISLGFNSDGTLVATAGYFDATVRVWNAKTGARVRELPPKVPSGFASFSFSDDGRRIVTANANGNVVRVWDLQTDKPILSIEWNKANLLAHPVFSPDGSRLAFATSNSIQVWALEPNKLLFEFTHDEPYKGASSISFSADGQRLATAGADRTARIWNLATGDELVWLPHYNRVKKVEFSSNGRALLTYDWSQIMRGWDLGSGKELFRLSHGGTIQGITYNQQSNRVVTRQGALAQVWDMHTGHKVAELSLDSDVQRLALSSDGRRLVTVASDTSVSKSKSAEVWDVDARQKLFRLTHEDDINAVTFNADDTWILTGSDDRTVRIWDSATGQELARLTHDEAVFRVLVNADSSSLAAAIESRSGSGSSLREVQVWHVPTKTTLARVPLYNNTLKEFAFDANGHWIAMADGKPTVRLIDPHSAHPEVLQLRHQHWPSSMALSPDGKRVATVEYMQLASHGSSEASRRRFLEAWNSTLEGKSTGKGESTEKGENRIWDLATGQVIATMPHDGGVYQIALHPAGNLIATAGADHTARLWDATTGMQLGQLTHQENVNDVLFSPDGVFVATRTTAGASQLWNTIARKAITVAEDGYVNRLAFSPDNRQLATAEGDVNTTQDGQGSARFAIAGGQAQTPTVGNVATEPDEQGEAPQQRPAGIIGVRLWDVATGENRLYLPHKKPVENILFSPDGRRIATDMFLKRQDKVQLWDTTTGERIASMQASPQGAGIGVQAFSPNGQHLAAKTGNEVLIWEVESGQEVKRLLHANGVGDVVFSASGQYLAAANKDKISIWDWTQGREIARLSHDNEITAIAFTPDDHRIISASQDKTVRVWAWQADDLITDACARLERNLTHEEWRTYLREEDYKPACTDIPAPDR